MAKKARNRTADYAVYLAVRFFVCVMQMVTPRIAFAFGDAVGWVMYRVVRLRREIVRENVRASFPELAGDPAALEQIVRGMYAHFARSMIELVLLPRKLHLTTWRKYMALEGVGVPDLLRGRAALIVTAHFGNWEMAGFALGRLGFRTFAIARVLDNPYLERYALWFRQRTGQTIIAKNDDF